jgi:hypothetical protein
MTTMADRRKSIPLWPGRRRQLLCALGQFDVFLQSSSWPGIAVEKTGLLWTPYLPAIYAVVPLRAH